MNNKEQARFPGEDLSHANADRFSLLLCDEELLEMLHEKAEAIRYSYKIGHEYANYILELSEEFSEEQLAAIDYGMAVQEAASSLAHAETEAQGRKDLQSNGDMRLKVVRSLGRISRNPFDGLGQLSEQFREGNPMSANLVGELAEDRFSHRYVDDAIAGAALTRHIELKAAQVG